MIIIVFGKLWWTLRYIVDILSKIENEIQLNEECKPSRAIIKGFGYMMAASAAVFCSQHNHMGDCPSLPPNRPNSLNIHIFVDLQAALYWGLINFKCNFNSFSSKHSDDSWVQFVGLLMIIKTKYFQYKLAFQVCNWLKLHFHVCISSPNPIKLDAFPLRTLLHTI